MRAWQLLSAGLSFFASAYAAPVSSNTSQTTTTSVPPVSTNGGGHKSGGAEHIILLSAHAPHIHEVLSRFSLHPEHSDVRYVFNNSAFRGFVGNMDAHCLSLLSNMNDVSHEATIQVAVQRSLNRRGTPHQYSVSTSTTTSEPAAEAASAPQATGSAAIPVNPTYAYSTRTNAPWGLQRISSLDGLPSDADPDGIDYTYTYAASSTLGRGVDIYIVDSGVNTGHIAFGGRARMGFSSVPDTSDTDGHGTHCAGTAAANVFGVASGANIIGVKVLSGPNTRGSTADCIAGMDYVISTHDARKAEPGFVGSVMSMSWAIQGGSTAIDAVVASAAAAGVHVAVAAGNHNDTATGADVDSCAFSPADAGGKNSRSVISVGSVDPADHESTFSNVGECVDLLAPGESVLSTWTNGSNVVNYLSGTSMATPHVSGVMAYLLAAEPALSVDTVAMKSRVLALTQYVNGRRILNNGNGMLATNLKRKRKRWVGEGAWDTEDEAASVRRQLRW